MSFQHLAPLLAAIAFTPVFGGCTHEDNFEDSELRLRVASDHNTLSVASELTWFRNSVADINYEGWSTQYELDRWQRELSKWSIELRDQEFQWPTAYVSAGEVELHFSLLEYGFGWVALYLAPEQALPLDLAELGLHSEESINTSNCQLKDARILVSLSSFTGSADNLIEMSHEAALDSQEQTPTTWHQLVLNPTMYNFLFFDNASPTLRDTTFAYMALQLDPTCGDTRFALRSEQELVGFVQFEH